MIKKILKRFVPRSLLNTYHHLLGLLAACIYRYPSRRLIVIGVTGTKGKSTTANLIAQLLEQLGHTVGLTTTVNFKVGSNEWLNDKKMTMLGRFELQKLLRRMVTEKCDIAVIETSSEGIAQWRHSGIDYDIALFTNLTPEHIESHGSFEAYRDAKEKLFSNLKNSRKKKLFGNEIKKVMVINGDDQESERLLRYDADKKILYGTSPHSAIQMSSVVTRETGLHFTLNKTPVTSKLIGDFNAFNIAASVSAVSAVGNTLPEIISKIDTLRPIPGRQEWINEGQPFRVMVDYAYEPVSQNKLYALLTIFKKNRIIHVTGSTGGGRDKKRRFELGELAGRNADIVIVTNEDPYDEDPGLIIRAVAEGARAAGKINDENLYVIDDRKEAIAQALTLAEKNDIVLITGKGSEQAMCVAYGKKIPWDDRVVVRSLIHELHRL